MAKLSIKFDDNATAKPAIVIPPAPASSLQGVLPERLETEEEKRSIVCTDYLDDEALEQARRKAAQLYPEMLANYAVLIQYGKAEVAKLNELVARMDKEIQLVEVPELLEMARELGYAVSGLQQKHDPTNPKVKQRTENELNGKKGWFARGQSLVQQILVDQRKTEEHIAQVEAVWQEKVNLLVHNVALDDELYKQNEEEIIAVIGAIAVMELIRDMAVADIAAIKVDPNNPGDRMNSEKKRELSAFVDVLNLKMGEYRNRMIIGWTTSPQISNRRNANVGLITKLESQRDLIVPLLKQVVQGWTLNIQSQGVAKLSNILSDTAAQMFVAYAENGAEMMPGIVESAHKPTLPAEIIAQVADLVAKENDDTLKVLRSTREQHNQASAAMVRAQRLMQESSENASDFVLEEQIKSAARRLSS